MRKHKIKADGMTEWEAVQAIGKRYVRWDAPLTIKKVGECTYSMTNDVDGEKVVTMCVVIAMEKNDRGGLNDVIYWVGEEVEEPKSLPLGAVPWGHRK